jgi:hypothetical protein
LATVDKVPVMVVGEAYESVPSETADELAIFPVAPETKPVPVTVTETPDALPGRLAGETEVIVGAAST